MKRLLLLAAAVAAIAVLWPRASHTAQTPRPAVLGDAAFRILLGVSDAQPARWDGSIQLSGGRVTALRGWRFTAADSVEGTSWKAASRRAPAQNAAAKKANRAGPMQETGVIVAVALDDPAARFRVETTQGSFTFSAQEVPLGASRPMLGGRATVERVPATAPLTTSENNEDFPAVAQRGDDVWVAFVEFTGATFSAAERARALTEEPKSFDYLSRAPGGDQVFLMHYSKAQNSWDRPVAVSEPGQDVMRTAAAVDGAGRVWVIWSANRDGNSDLYARASSGGKWAGTIRLTTGQGPDLNPVAATDAAGRVWVAWQGFRDGNLDVLAMVQSGDAFSHEQRVSFSPQSDWDPAIAASSSGDIAISWDTYDKGDYDVYFRRLRMADGIQMDAPVAVAVSAHFEARSTVAFDARNRLWVAYEGSSTKWGKDFGAYETSGVALYQGHNIQVKCFEGRNAFTPPDLEAVLPGAAPLRPRQARQRLELRLLPDAGLAAARPQGAAAQVGPTPLNSFPRLATDSAGTVFLAYRTPGGPARTAVGTAWQEEVVWLAGDRWAGPVFVPDTDNLLDNRPAMAALSPGQLLMVSAMDHRLEALPGGRRRNPGAVVNSDLFAARFGVQPAAAPPRLTALAAEKPAPQQPEVRLELEQVAAMRGYRVTLGAEKLQLMRGEFHRHTEYSLDGGRDGPLIDAYRYMIDAAYMDWVACCDHDNGGGHEYFWWIQQKLTDAYQLGGRFVPMFGYERSVRYPEGHRNLVMATRGVRPLPRLPKMDDDSPSAPAPDTQMLYRYLKRYGAIVASHTSGTDMGTDWRDNDPLVEPVVEIYQGDRQNYEMPGAPRSNSKQDSIGGWRPLGFVSLALQKGYRLGFQASSDHISTHMSYCNLWVTQPTREGIMEALRKRRIYGATDNILAEVRSGEHFMGEEFSVAAPPSFSVKLRGTAEFAKVHIIRDNQYVYSIEPSSRDVSFTWRDNNAARGKTSYYYVRGEQKDGELVWVSPMWIRYQ